MAYFGFDELDGESKEYDESKFDTGTNFKPLSAKQRDKCQSCGSTNKLEKDKYNGAFYCKSCRDYYNSPSGR